MRTWWLQGVLSPSLARCRKKGLQQTDRTTGALSLVFNGINNVSGRNCVFFLGGGALGPPTRGTRKNDRVARRTTLMGRLKGVPSDGQLNAGCQPSSPVSTAKCIVWLRICTRRAGRRPGDNSEEAHRGLHYLFIFILTYLFIFNIKMQIKPILNMQHTQPVRNCIMFLDPTCVGL